MDDLVMQDGLYYRKFTNVPFTGKSWVKNREPSRMGSNAVLGSVTTTTGR